MLFDIMSRLPEIESKVDRETLKICIQVDMFKLFSTEQDRKAALPNDEDASMA